MPQSWDKDRDASARLVISDCSTAQRKAGILASPVSVDGSNASSILIAGHDLGKIAGPEIVCGMTPHGGRAA
jgi:hypothetical protein